MHAVSVLHKNEWENALIRIQGHGKGTKLVMTPTRRIIMCEARKTAQHQYAHRPRTSVHLVHTFQIGLTSLSYHGIIQPLGRLRVSLIVHYNPYKTSREKSTIRYREERNMGGIAPRSVLCPCLTNNKSPLTRPAQEPGGVGGPRGSLERRVRKCATAREIGWHTLNNAEAGTGLALSVGVSVDSGIALDVDSGTTMSLSTWTWVPREGRNEKIRTP